MFWRIIQLVVFVGVGGFISTVNIGTVNDPYTAGGAAISLIAAISAFIVTWLLSKIIDLTALGFRVAPKLKPYFLTLLHDRLDKPTNADLDYLKRRDPPPLEQPR